MDHKIMQRTNKACPLGWCRGDRSARDSDNSDGAAFSPSLDPWLSKNENQIPKPLSFETQPKRFQRKFLWAFEENADTQNLVVGARESVFNDIKKNYENGGYNSENLRI